jgi:hypothetical protein
MLDTYYQQMIPTDCSTGTYKDAYGNPVSTYMPLVYFKVTNERTRVSTTKYYYDQFSYPVLLTSNDY